MILILIIVTISGCLSCLSLPPLQQLCANKTFSSTNKLGDVAEILILGDSICILSESLQQSHCTQETTHPIPTAKHHNCNNNNKHAKPPSCPSTQSWDSSSCGWKDHNSFGASLWGWRDHSLGALWQPERYIFSYQFRMQQQHTTIVKGWKTHTAVSVEFVCVYVFFFLSFFAIQSSFSH